MVRQKRTLFFKQQGKKILRVQGILKNRAHRVFIQNIGPVTLHLPSQNNKNLPRLEPYFWLQKATSWALLLTSYKFTNANLGASQPSPMHPNIKPHSIHKTDKICIGVSKFVVSQCLWGLSKFVGSQSLWGLKVCGAPTNFVRPHKLCAAPTNFERPMIRTSKPPIERVNLYWLWGYLSWRVHSSWGVHPPRRGNLRMLVPTWSFIGF